MWIHIYLQPKMLVIFALLCMAPGAPAQEEASTAGAFAVDAFYT